MTLKTRTLLLLSTLVTCATFVAAGPAGAQGMSPRRYGPTWEITPFVGYYIASDLYRAAGVNGTDGTIGLDNSAMYGGRLGFYPSPAGGLEFAYTRTGSDLSVKHSGTPVGGGFNPGDLGRVDIDNYDFNFVARQTNYSNSRAMGFFTMGLGWAVAHPDLKNAPNFKSNEPSMFTWNFGLGGNITMTQRLDLRLEGRWKVTDLPFETGSYTWCDIYGYCYQYTTSWYNSGELTAGLTFKFQR